MQRSGRHRCGASRPLTLQWRCPFAPALWSMSASGIRVPACAVSVDAAGSTSPPPIRRPLSSALVHRLQNVKVGSESDRHSPDPSRFHLAPLAVEFSTWSPRHPAHPSPPGSGDRVSIATTVGQHSRGILTCSILASRAWRVSRSARIWSAV